MGELHLNVKPVIIKTREKQGDVSMEVTIYREPCWLLEAAELVYGLVNQVPVERMTASGAYCIPAGEVKRIQEVACAGISPEDIVRQQLPVPLRDMRPVTPEEIVVCLADKFFSKTRLEQEKTVEQARRSLEKFGEEGVKRFDRWCALYL